MMNHIILKTRENNTNGRYLLSEMVYIITGKSLNFLFLYPLNIRRVIFFKEKPFYFKIRIQFIVKSIKDLLDNKMKETVKTFLLLLIFYQYILSLDAKSNSINICL